MPIIGAIEPPMGEFRHLIKKERLKKRVWLSVGKIWSTEKATATNSVRFKL